MKMLRGLTCVLGSKKGRFFSGIDNSDGVSVSDENNGIADAAETYRTEGLFEDEASGEFGHVIFGGLTLVNEWDFDVNFDLLFGNTEQQSSLGYDLNVPVFGSSGGVTETGVQEFTQERPLIKENIVEIIDIVSDDSDDDLNVPVFGSSGGVTETGVQEFTQERPLIKENRMEIIDIVSDDSDDDVEIVGFNYGCKENSEQKGVGMSYDTVENSNLGLEMDKMDWFVGESSLVAGCEGRYTREEKGKTHMDDSWLALDSYHPVLLDLWPKILFNGSPERILNS